VQAGGLIKADRRATGTPFSEADGLFSVPRRMLHKLLTVMPGDAVEIEYEPIKADAMIQQYGADAEVTFVEPKSRTALLRYR
jgi:hypothetical protein